MNTKSRPKYQLIYYNENWMFALTKLLIDYNALNILITESKLKCIFYEYKGQGNEFVLQGT